MTAVKTTRSTKEGRKIMKKDVKKNTRRTANAPACPRCKTKVPIPGFVGTIYKCPSCGTSYVVDAEFVRIYKTTTVMASDGEYK